MEIMVASLFSGKVLMWQVILGAVQFAGRTIGGRVGGVVGFILVLWWTLTQTYGDLILLQLIVQGAIAFFLFSMDE